MGRTSEFNILSSTLCTLCLLQSLSPLSPLPSSTSLDEMPPKAFLMPSANAQEAPSFSATRTGFRFFFRDVAVRASLSVDKAIEWACCYHWGQGPKYPPGTCWIHWEYRQQVTPMCPVGIVSREYARTYCCSTRGIVLGLSVVGMVGIKGVVGGSEGRRGE